MEGDGKKRAKKPKKTKAKSKRPRRGKTAPVRLALSPSQPVFTSKTAGFAPLPGVSAGPRFQPAVSYTKYIPAPPRQFDPLNVTGPAANLWDFMTDYRRDEPMTMERPTGTETRAARGAPSTVE